MGIIITHAGKKRWHAKTITRRFQLEMAVQVVQ
jgi:hypothetical protein